MEGGRGRVSYAVESRSWFQRCIRLGLVRELGFRHQWGVVLETGDLFQFEVLGS